jgi:hypothetical protein
MRTMRRRLGTLVALAAAALVFVLVVDGGSFGGAVPRPTSAASTGVRTTKIAWPLVPLVSSAVTT